ncbi:transcriptional regulator [Antrihabitans cavernicola]|uniref:Transcriptional regulator n=2 Tax=Antrihabitans cavernicola TaxID=2495913 RepID=A0A5A7S777_9NOCA|nr:transcriptional regulator [Spelaeibacter cavernicola]
MSPKTADRRLVPTDLAALAAGVEQATIRKWASRGKLTRYGKPSHAQYDLFEIFTLTGGALPTH